MRDVSLIILHEAACPLHKPSGAEFTITDIDQWHIERGFKRTTVWRDIWHPELKACGYHYVIGVQGQVWPGRHLDEVPAAVKGFNSISVNICLIGQGKYTIEQWAALKTLVTTLTAKYPDVKVTGHCNPAFKSGKTCPDFDVEQWYVNNMEPAEGDIA